MGESRPFEGKYALVSGSSRGIGRVVAEHLASLGAAVAIHGSSPTSTRAFNEADSLQSVADEISEATGSRVLPVSGDLRDFAVVEALIQQVREAFGCIDFLVNVAGGDIGAEGTFGSKGGKPQPNDAVFVPLADLNAVLERNLHSCIYMCKAVAPEMMERRSGHIVNISSVDGSIGLAKGSIYATSKAGVSHYTRCLATQLREYNVHVNAIAPGSIVTARFSATRELEEPLLATDGTLIRYGRPIEIARVVEFFCSPLSSYVSGQVLRVDGAEQVWPG